MPIIPIVLTKPKSREGKEKQHIQFIEHGILKGYQYFMLGSLGRIKVRHGEPSGVTIQCSKKPWTFKLVYEGLWEEDNGQETYVTKTFYFKLKNPERDMMRFTEKYCT